jgi:hypothetical protein
VACQEAVYQWTAEVGERFPELGKPQAAVLALWSLGMVLARSCALTAVSAVLATWQGRKENTVRQQLREWCYAAEDKRGAKRREVDVATCFVPPLRWVLAGYRGQQVPLALDATGLGERFVVLAVSVVYRGGAIPVAWHVLPANQPEAWRGHWLHLLRQVRPAVPSRLTVIALADRGLYARWLFGRIRRLGWHPLLRINAGGTFRPAGARAARRLSTFAPRPGTCWQGTGIAFQGRQRRLPCTLLARWEPGHRDPWPLLTDLAPEAADPCWYGMRTWIEQGFKLTKRGGWQWQRTRMTDPDRAARLWLALAVATLWLLLVGGEAEELPDGPLPDLPPGAAPPRRQRRATRLRLASAFRRGWIVILVALLEHRPLPTGTFRPEPWPAADTAPIPLQLPLPGLDDAA